jgi:hypothetical protein
VKEAENSWHGKARESLSVSHDLLIKVFLVDETGIRHRRTRAAPGLGFVSSAPQRKEQGSQSRTVIYLYGNREMKN